MAALSSLTPEIVQRRYPRFNFHLSAPWMKDFMELSGMEMEELKEGQSLPAFSVVCLRDAEFFVIESLDIRLDQLLHTTQKYEYLSELKVGDWIESESGVRRVSHRKTREGSVVILEMFNDYYRDGEIVARSTGTVFVREENQS